MLEKIIYDFFFLNLKNYPNIGIDFEINVFLLFMVIALCVACFFINYRRAQMQGVIKQLIRHSAKDEASAKTLREIGLADSPAIRRALSGWGSRLTKIVGRVGEKTYTYEEYKKLSKQKGGVPKEVIDFADARFYIRQTQADRARFILDNYGTSTIRTVLYCVLFLAVYCCVVLAMPEILSLINDFLGNF